MAEQARLRIIRALWKEKGLTWTTLLKETKLSSRSLTLRLEDLSRSDFITKIRGSEPRGSKEGSKPQMFYSLTREGTKEFGDIFRPLEEALKIAGKMAEFQDLLFEHARLYGEKDIEKVARKYFDMVVAAITAIYEIELLRPPTGTFRDSFLSSEILSIVRSILWENDFVRKFEEDTKSELGVERKENEEKLDREIARLRRDILKRKM